MLLALNNKMPDTSKEIPKVQKSWGFTTVRFSSSVISLRNEIPPSLRSVFTILISLWGSFPGVRWLCFVSVSACELPVLWLHLRLWFLLWLKTPSALAIRKLWEEKERERNVYYLQVLEMTVYTWGHIGRLQGRKKEGTWQGSAFIGVEGEGVGFFRFALYWWIKPNSRNLEHEKRKSKGPNGQLPKSTKSSRTKGPGVQGWCRG